MKLNSMTVKRARSETTGRDGLTIGVDFPWDASACMGTGAYSETMVRALATAAPSSRIYLMVSKESPRSLQIPNVRYVTLPHAPFRQEGARHVALPAMLRKAGADCLFAPATLLPAVKPCPMVATVHDLTFISNPEYYSPELLGYLGDWFPTTLKAADLVIAVSDAARDALVNQVRFDPDRIVVIPQPVRAEFLDRLSEQDVLAQLRALRVEGPFFFHVSNLAPHKNLRFAMAAFAACLHELREPDLRFVIAGGGFAPNRPPDLFEMASALGVEARVQFVGRVPDRALKALYQGCRAFLFPSLAEGWGLPVAEASTLGARVVASPFVPAARLSDRIALDLDSWVATLLVPSTDRVRPDYATLEEAGKTLYEVLDRVAKRPSPSAPARESKPQRIADLDVAIRGDWQSPSGFGQAARGILQGLRTGGLSPRAVSIPKDAIQDGRLWKSPSDAQIGRADLWIHQLPPEYFDFSLPGRHTAMFLWETDRLPKSISVPWVERLNRLDEIWVPATFLVEVLKSGGVGTASHVCRIPIDTTIYAPGPRRAPPIPFPQGFDPTWSVFLYVGTWDPRKRPDILVKAFCRAFSSDDRALLILKTYVTGDPHRDRQILDTWVAEVRTGTAHVEILPEVLDEQQMADLHRFSTVFVTASRGEGYGLPALQSMACGRPSMGVSWSAMADYISIPVRHRLEHVPAQVRLPGYSLDQRWAAIDEGDLVAKLAWAHTHRLEVERLGRAGRSWVEKNASFESAGSVLRARIESLLKNKAKIPLETTA